MADSRFVTTWCLDAPIERVFDAIDDAAAWPQWWRGVRGTGLPYGLTFESRVTRREPPYLLEGSADGELIGTGAVMRQGGEGLARLLGAPLLVRS